MDISRDDQALCDLLATARVIAVVGHSDKPHRTSYQIARFLRQSGFTVYAVNPQVDQIDGERCFAALQEVPQPVDVVNVFRRSEFLPAIVEQAASVGAKAVWAQLGVSSREASERAAALGLKIVMDACIKVEYNRLIR